MNKAAALFAEYKRKLQELQDSCPHNGLSDWMEIEWALGKFENRNVKGCLECNKIVHSKYWCTACGKELIDNEMHRGKADSPFPSLWKTDQPFCIQCLDKPYDHNKPGKRQMPSAWDVLKEKTCQLSGTSPK